MKFANHPFENALIEYFNFLQQQLRIVSSKFETPYKIPYQIAEFLITKRQFYCLLYIAIAEY